MQALLSWLSILPVSAVHNAPNEQNHHSIVLTVLSVCTDPGVFPAGQGQP